MAKFTAEQLLNHLYNRRLPQVYRQADADTEYSLKRFLQSMIEGGFTEAITSADGIVDLTDPLKCPDKIFPYLFESFGYKYSADIPLLYQRKILQNHGELYQKRGSIEYIYVLTRILTGFDCEVNIERVDGVRLLTITMFVDSSITSVESQYYITLVKRFVSQGYIPFYLDVETNIVVDVIDIPTAQQYIGKFVEVEGIIDMSPIEEVSGKGLTFSLSPTLLDEPFTKFDILGYSKIVPRYIGKNLIHPNTSQTNVNVSYKDPETGSTSVVRNASLYTDYLYVPYGNTLYFTLVSAEYSPPNVRIFVYNSRSKEYLGFKEIKPTQFVGGKANINISDLLKGNECETDYYIRLCVIDYQGVPVSDRVNLLSVWVEDVEYEAYSATTRFKFDNEYNKNGESYPIYQAEVFDSNGPINFPYCSLKEFICEENYAYGQLTLTNKVNAPFIVYTDCNTAMKDDSKYYISFMLKKAENNVLSSPIVTALCTNNKGSYSKLFLKKEVENYSEEDGLYRYAYSFTVPQDYNVVRIEYKLCDTNKIGDVVSIYAITCYECDPRTGNPYIDNPPQPYVLDNSLNTFKNNLTVGIDGIELLSYNDSNGKVIVRDSFDVLTGTITKRVGVNYDSLNNPVSVYALSKPYTEKVNEDLNGEVKAIDLNTFIGKTYMSLCNSIPNSRYLNTGGADYHSCIEFTTKIIK